MCISDVFNRPYPILTPTFTALIPGHQLGRFAPSGFALRARILSCFAPSSFVLCIRILGRLAPLGFVLHTRFNARALRDAPPSSLLKIIIMLWGHGTTE